MDRHKVTIGAFAIITNSQKEVLLCYRNDLKKWNLPGGRMENGESPWEAVVREVKEEVGLEVKVVRLVNIFSKADMKDISFQFECEVVGGDLTISDESADNKYFSLDQIPKNIVLNHGIGVKQYYDGVNEVILKSQLQRLFINLNGEEIKY
ncbi:MAG: NUDIX domain-containing protein [Candidatus Komeilibacteria bacterium]